VLGVVAAADLDEAITIQNDTAYGLTAGLQSLDPDEVIEWLARVEAGNLYVNRGITGAVVQRQPFGGWKRSAVGPTAKAGGPNYVATLCRWIDTGLPIDEVAERFERWMATVGRAEIDATGLASERNLFRYRPLPGGVLARFGSDVPERERLILRTAAAATGTRLLTSDAATEPAEALADRLAATGVDRLRLLGADGATDGVREAAHRAGIAVDDAAPVGAPEIELPRWLREQSVTITNHRHGRITPLLAPPPDDVRDTLADRPTRRRRVL
jgi:RHH-type proline utilization regulon transcriptional repressor/proline dehydrogenase/delta 1-pyrroline-5-carboxylate dehydrogenase